MLFLRDLCGLCALRVIWILTEVLPDGVAYSSHEQIFRHLRYHGEGGNFQSRRMAL